MTPCLRWPAPCPRAHTTRRVISCVIIIRLLRCAMSTHTHTPPFAARDRAARGCAGCEVRVCLSPYGFRTFRSPRRFARGFAVLYALCRWGAADYTALRSTAEFDSRKWASAAVKFSGAMSLSARHSGAPCQARGVKINPCRSDPTQDVTFYTPPAHKLSGRQSGQQFDQFTRWR